MLQYFATVQLRNATTLAKQIMTFETPHSGVSCRPCYVCAKPCDINMQIQHRKLLMKFRSRPKIPIAPYGTSMMSWSAFVSAHNINTHSLCLETLVKQLSGLLTTRVSNCMGIKRHDQAGQCNCLIWERKGWPRILTQAQCALCYQVASCYKLAYDGSCSLRSVAAELIDWYNNTRSIVDIIPHLSKFRHDTDAWT